MIRVKLNGQRYECVSSYQELKTRQYIRILKEWDPDKEIADRDYFKLLGILTDSDFSRVERTPENELAIIGAVGWIISQPFNFSNSPPKVLSFQGKVIDIPEDISELSIGQSIHLRQILEKSKTIEENISIAVAVYLQPIIENRMFHMKRAENIAKEIDEMPAHLIYPVGFFLLKRALNFGQKPVSNWSLLRASLKKRLRKMWRSLRRSMSFSDMMIYH